MSNQAQYRDVPLECPLCGALVKKAEMLAHRTVCYVQDIAYGGQVKDPKTGEMVDMEVLNGEMTRKVKAVQKTVTPPKPPTQQEVNQKAQEKQAAAMAPTPEEEAAAKEKDANLKQ